MKAVLDEHLSPQLAVMMRERGHEWSPYATGTGLGDRRASFQAAAIDGRALVTADVGDFRQIGAERIVAGRDHPGLILLASSRSASRDALGSVAESINAIMGVHPDGIANRDLGAAAVALYAEPKGAGRTVPSRKHPSVALIGRREQAACR